MLILKSELFDRFPEIVFAFSTKIGLNREAPYHFNLSLSVDDISAKVEENRIALFDNLGIPPNDIAYQKQVHGDNIKIVDRAGQQGESDAMITAEPGIALAVSSADCCAVFLYDSSKKILAAVHSGWRGTSKKIVRKTLSVLFNDYGSLPRDLYAYVSPSISQNNYEVGKEVADRFDPQFVEEESNRYLLDIGGINYQTLTDNGIDERRIQYSHLCSYDYGRLFHSYRREGKRSGRALGIIMVRK